MNDIYTHIQLSPWDIIKIDVAPDGEVSLTVKWLDADTWRLVLTDGTTSLISQWSFFLKEKEWVYRPINE